MTLATMRLVFVAEEEKGGQPDKIADPLNLHKHTQIPRRRNA
jgi:hypothetical protein